MPSSSSRLRRASNTSSSSLRHQALVAVDHRHLAAESTHRLRQLDPDVAAADDQQMFGNHIQFQRLDVRQRLRLGKPGNRLPMLPVCRY